MTIKPIKRLKIEIINNYQLTNVSKLYIIKPIKNIRNNTINLLNNNYDLSFSDISQVIFREDNYGDMKLVPGIWQFGWTDSTVTNLSQLNDIKKYLYHIEIFYLIIMLLF